MDDPKFLTLLTLIKLKNYTKTAERLFITQPAVTHHIQALEKEYDINIFTSARGFVLTRQGEILVEYARRTINESKELTSAIANSMKLNKTINLGITETSQSILKEGTLSSIMEVYESPIDVQVLGYKEIFDDVKSGKLDMAIIDTNYDDDSFAGELLAVYNLVPVCYINGKFAEIKRVTREMLKNNPVVISSKENGLANVTENALKFANINLRRTFFLHANNSFAMANLLETYDGIGFMYKEQCDLYPNLKKMELVNFKASQGIYLIYSLNSYDRIKIKKLLKAIKQQVNKNVENNI